jgi:Putative MetA-pathway of phenol degradation
MKFQFMLALPAALAVVTTVAAAAVPDKSGYSFSNPVPAAWLRELTTDRPDATEGPYTVDAGHLQIEGDFATFTRNRLDGVRTRELSVAPFNLRVGVLNNFELGLFLDPYVRHSEEPPGSRREIQAGFGDLTVRAKFNFRGNEGGEPASGLIVDLKLPTAHRGLGNGAVEGAFFLPISLELSGGWELGAMTGLQIRHQEGGGSRGVWINTATLGHDLAEKISGYVELTSETGDGPQVATFNVGVAWQLNSNTQLDTGVNLGLSCHADDGRVFAGISRRF